MKISLYWILWCQSNGAGNVSVLPENVQIFTNTLQIQSTQETTMTQNGDMNEYRKFQVYTYVFTCLFGDFVVVLLVSWCFFMFGCFF